MEIIDQRIKKELESVFITSDGRKFLNYIDALYAELEIQKCIDIKLSKRKRIMDTVELIMQILTSENWGIYYKSQPIQPLETQDGSALYKINQVDDKYIERAIIKKLEEGDSWKNSQTNKDQMKSSEMR